MDFWGYQFLSIAVLASSLTVLFIAKTILRWTASFEARLREIDKLVAGLRAGSFTNSLTTVQSAGPTLIRDAGSGRVPALATSLSSRHSEEKAGQSSSGRASFVEEKPP